MGTTDDRIDVILKLESTIWIDLGMGSGGYNKINVLTREEGISAIFATRQVFSKGRR